MKRQKTVGSRIFNFVNYTILGLFTLLCTFPFYYVFINTISDNRESELGRVLFWPVGIHFGNYVEVFRIDLLAGAAVVSVARTFIGTFVTVIGTSLLGYCFSKQEMWGRTFWYRYVLVTMYFSAGIIPWFMTMRALNLTNNFLAYILPGIVAPFSLILFKTYVESLPAELEESAAMDGAGYIRRFVYIVFPLCTPIVATIAVFTSVGHWNSFMDTVLLMTRPELYTLQYVLHRYLNELNALAQQIRQMGMLDHAEMDVSRLITPTAVRLTITMVVTVPILFVYPFLQKYFVKGIMLGAVKG